MGIAEDVRGRVVVNHPDGSGEIEPVIVHGTLNSHVGCRVVPQPSAGRYSRWSSRDHSTIRPWVHQQFVYRRGTDWAGQAEEQNGSDRQAESTRYWSDQLLAPVSDPIRQWSPIAIGEVRRAYVGSNVVANCSQSCGDHGEPPCIGMVPSPMSGRYAHLGSGATSLGSAGGSVTTHVSRNHRKRG